MSIKITHMICVDRADVEKVVIVNSTPEAIRLYLCSSYDCKSFDIPAGAMEVSNLPDGAKVAIAAFGTSGMLNSLCLGTEEGEQFTGSYLNVEVDAAVALLTGSGVYSGRSPMAPSRAVTTYLGRVGGSLAAALSAGNHARVVLQPIEDSDGDTMRISAICGAQAGKSLTKKQSFAFTLEAFDSTGSILAWKVHLMPLPPGLADSYVLEVYFSTQIGVTYTVVGRAMVYNEATSDWTIIDQDHTSFSAP